MGLEILHEIVAIVLCGLLVAVANHHLPRRAVGGRNAFKQVAHEAVVVVFQRIVVPSVHFRPAPVVLKGGRVHNHRGGHIGANHLPCADGEGISERIAVEIGRQIKHVGGGNDVASRVIDGSFPFIIAPHRQRNLHHFAQNLVGKLVNDGCFGERNLAQLARLVQMKIQSEPVGNGLGQ